MIDFMIIGLPRSGTTWLANLLSTADTICVHDPLYYAHYTEFDTLFNTRYPGFTTYGLSCTGIWRWLEWLNDHPAKKIILHNDFSSIQNSLADMGLPLLEPNAPSFLHKISGVHVETQEVFENIKCVKKLWSLATPEPFNEHRYRHLLDMYIQPSFERISLNKKAIAKLYRELESCRHL